MKKILFSCMLFTAICTYSQKFELTPENFKNIDNKEQNFVVLDFTGKTKDELFKKVKIYINSTYKNLKGDAYNEVEPDQIILKVSAISATKKLLGTELSMGSFVNQYEINFKDGKIMVKPVFSYVMQNDGSGGEKKVYLSGGGILEKTVFNKSGKLSIKDKVFEGIEIKTNEFVVDLSAGIIKKSDW